MRFGVVKTLVRVAAVAVVAAGLGLLATALAGPRDAAPSGVLTQAECKSMEGTVTNAGDGQWSCCFREIGQCWFPETTAGGAPASVCRGDGCPSDAKIAKLYKRLGQTPRESAN
ncbi:MAG: hypothetical protein U1F33_01435 [Alphaproteobacteria bacterium]